MSVPRATRRRKQCVWGSPSDLVGRASQTWEGGNAPAGLVRRTHAVDKTSGRPTTGATYKHVLHAKLEACTLTFNACCSLPISTRHCARAVKGMDSKSIGLCPQGLESPRCRLPRGHHGLGLNHGCCMARVSSPRQSCPYVAPGSIPGAPACFLERPKRLVLSAGHSRSKVPS